MNNKKVLSLLIKSALILTSIGMLTACGESSDNTYDSSVTSSNSYNSSDYSSDSYSGDYDSSDYDDDDSNSYSSYSSNNSSSYSSSYDSNDYSSSDYDNNYSEGHSYDKSDPFYSANDVDGDGKLTDEEWQNAMDDAITYYFYKSQENNWFKLYCTSVISEITDI